MYKQRKIYKQVSHAHELAIRGADGDQERLINLLAQILKDHAEARRKTDKRK